MSCLTTSMLILWELFIELKNNRLSKLLLQVNCMVLIFQGLGGSSSAERPRHELRWHWEGYQRVGHEGQKQWTCRWGYGRGYLHHQVHCIIMRQDRLLILWKWLSNGGVFGSLFGTPIINPPQSAILGMHGTFERPVVRNGQVVLGSKTRKYKDLFFVTNYPRMSWCCHV